MMVDVRGKRDGRIPSKSKYKYCNALAWRLFQYIPDTESDNDSDNTEAKKCSEFVARLNINSEMGKSQLIVPKNVEGPPSIVHTRAHFSR